MRDLMRTNDPVLLNFVQTLLREAGIEAVIFDGNMSALQGTVEINSPIWVACHSATSETQKRPHARFRSSMGPATRSQAIELAISRTAASRYWVAT